MATQFLCAASEPWDVFMFFQKGFRNGAVIYLAHKLMQKQ